MFRKTGIAILIGVVIGAVIFLLVLKGPDLTRFEPLKNPRITTMKDRKMVVVEATGDPNAVAAKAFGLLFKTYYKIEGIAKWQRPPSPVVRWSGDAKARSEWVGRYALPVPEGIHVLPQIDPEPGCKIELATWEYGTVAEILHIGPYSREMPAIERLIRFIKDNGYTIVGYHEEEYIKGPGIFFTGDPEKYYTIIRYRVQKAGMPQSPP
jgi:hypothetical protein